MSRNDFAAAFLQGLYNSGVGNPEVQRQEEQDKLQRAYYQSAINKNAADAGMVPDNTVHPETNKVLGMVKNVLFPGSNDNNMQMAFKPDPNLGTYAQDQAGKVSLLPAGQTIPMGTSKLDREKGASLLASQNKKTYLSDVSWDQATPQQQLLAERMVNGEIKPGDLSFRDRGQVVALASERAKQLGKPFRSYSGSVNEATAKSFSSGKAGQNATAINTALGHVSSAYDAFEKVGNTDQNWLNTPINTLREKTNDPNVIKLSIALGALQGELATVFKGSSGTDQQIKEWRDFLNRDLTPQQAYGAMVQVDDLLRSRQSALEYQRSGGLGSNPGAQSLVSPKAEETRQKLRNGGIPTINNDADFQKLKSGTVFLDGEGVRHTKK